MGHWHPMAVTQLRALVELVSLRTPSGACGHVHQKTRPLEHLLAGRSHVLGAPPRCFTGGAERRGGLTGYQWLTEQNRKSPAVAANRNLQVVASKEQPAGSTGEYHKYPKQLGVGGASQLAAGMGKGVFRFRVNQLTGRNGRKSLAVVANRKG